MLHAVDSEYGDGNVIVENGLFCDLKATNQRILALVSKITHEHSDEVGSDR